MDHWISKGYNFNYKISATLILVISYSICFPGTGATGGVPWNRSGVVGQISHNVVLGPITLGIGGESPSAADVNRVPNRTNINKCGECFRIYFYDISGISFLCRSSGLLLTQWDLHLQKMQ